MENFWASGETERTEDDANKKDKRLTFDQEVAAELEELTSNNGTDPVIFIIQ